jgi:hypothetical protein
MPSFYEIRFNGGALARGFWLYVWEVTPQRGPKLYYVGRTGDSSSQNAQSPFNRMGQHFGHAKNSCMLRTHLGNHKRKIHPERCTFRLVAYGPILPESKKRGEHERRRDKMAAAEKMLAEAMSAGGYEVMNTVGCRKEADQKLNRRVLAEFAKHFPRLADAN